MILKGSTRIIVPALLGIVAVASLFLLLSLFTSNTYNPRKSDSNDHVVSVITDNFLVGEEWDAYRSRIALLSRQVESESLKEELQHIMEKYECIPIQVDAHSVMDMEELAPQLFRMYEAFENRTTRSCFSYEWDGLDSIGLKYFIFSRPNPRYIAFYPSNLNNSPRLVDKEIEDVIFGYMDGRGFVVELQGLPRNINSYSFYKIQITFNEKYKTVQFKEILP